MTAPEPKRQITLRVATAELDAIDALAKKLDTSRSALIRRALREWMARQTRG